MNIQRERSHCSNAQREALESHFLKKGNFFQCAYCRRKVVNLQECPPTVGKYLHLTLYHKDVDVEERRIDFKSFEDIQKFFTNGSSAKGRNSKEQPGKEVTKGTKEQPLCLNPEAKWKSPPMNSLPKVKRTISSAHNDQAAKNKRKVSSEEDSVRRIKRPSNSPQECSKAKRQSLSPRSSSRETSPDGTSANVSDLTPRSPFF